MTDAGLGGGKPHDGRFSHPINVSCLQSCAVPSRKQNHGATIIEDSVSQKRFGVAHWDPARGQFAFSADNNDIVLNAADAAAIVVILSSLSR
jgi:hypothetical protein